MTTFTKLHVVISLIAIFAGLVVAFGLIAVKRLDGWTALFLVMTLLTSVTGFLFPFHGFTPAIGVGIVSLVVLAIAIFARYVRRLAGAWRWIYVVTAMLALYLGRMRHLSSLQGTQMVRELKAIPDAVRQALRCHDAVRTLRHPEVLERPTNHEGVFTFDLADNGSE
jgi:CBS domain containing-hemolysin-like protein